MEEEINDYGNRVAKITLDFIKGEYPEAVRDSMYKDAGYYLLEKLNNQIDLAVSKERERIVEKITKEWIPTKWEGYGGNLVKGMTLDDHKRNFSKEIINLINTK